MNPLRKLNQLGQSVWMDDIRRGWIADGSLKRLIEEDGLAGVTSNPAIFEKAMRGGEYDAAIRRLAAQGEPAATIYERLALDDIRAVADLLRPTHDAGGGADGYASLEVSPHLADDTEGTVAEARRLWHLLDRPNVMIKVPGTVAGLAAIHRLLVEGINVNVTLLFGLGRYRAVAECFLAALEQRVDAGRPIDRIASVASFFLSRIDTLVDARLDASGTPPARALRGRAAIASARLAYRIYREWTANPRWQSLAALGARPQRLLWASTSTKDPAYADTMYIEALIGPQTINTMTRATIDAYRDHGQAAPRLDEEIAEARNAVRELAELGIDLDEVSRQLEREGVQKFVEPFDKLHAALERQRAAAAP